MLGSRKIQKNPTQHVGVEWADVLIGELFDRNAAFGTWSGSV
jgi:hypothetical protein